jgi:hypothetical protein
MYCPKCGQQQLSNETRFCSRCGFLLTTIADVIANGGVLPQLLNIGNQKKSVFTKKNGVFFSILWLIFFLLVMAPFFGILTGVDELAGVSAIIGIFGGMIIALASLFFLQGEKSLPASYQQAAYPPQQQVFADPGMPMNALPPEQSIPASNYAPGNWRATNELVNRDTSEKATQLLDKPE